MSFPTIQFKASQVTVSDALKTLVEQKFESLEKYIGDETDVQCEVEFERVAPHQNGPVFRVEANVWLAGTLHRAEATEDSFERAVDQVRAELDSEIRNSRKKRDSMVKKGGRKLKEMLRFGR